AHRRRCRTLGSGRLPGRNPPLRGLCLHRRAGLGPGGGLPAFQRHPKQPDPSLAGRNDRRRDLPGAEPSFQRTDLGPRRQPDRLRALRAPGLPRPGRWRPRTGRRAVRRQALQQPQRCRRPSERRALLHRPDLRLGRCLRRARTAQPGGLPARSRWRHPLPGHQFRATERPRLLARRNRPL
ncbi:MAG: Gluconolactonase, partial [uncultured Thermomicrobiales bacterium]